MKKYLTLFTLFILSACTGMPDSVTPVQDFEAQKYLGTWYEIARLDHSFERGLSHVTANYSPKEDGGLVVINKGFSTEEQAWDEAQGKAYFVNNDTEGYLKVSFFGPFYGSYVIFELDDDYQYAFISGNNTNYLWLLARTPTVEQSVIDKFIEMAKARGFATDELIFVDQTSAVDKN